MSVTAANLLSSTATSASYSTDNANDAKKAATKAGAAQATAQAANFAAQLEKSLFGQKTLGLGGSNSNTDKEVGNLVDEMKSNSVSEKTDRIENRDDQAVNDQDHPQDDQDRDRAADDHRPVAAEQELIAQHGQGQDQQLGLQQVNVEAAVNTGPQQVQGAQQQAAQAQQQTMDVTNAPKGKGMETQLAQAQLAQAAQGDAGEGAFDPNSMRAGLGAKLAAGVTPEGQQMAQQQGQGQQGNAGQQQGQAPGKMTLAQNTLNALNGLDNKGMKGGDFAAAMQRNVQATGGAGIATKIAAQTAASQMAMATATSGVTAPDGAAPQSAFSLTSGATTVQQSSEAQQPQAARQPHQPPAPAQQVAVKIAQAAADGARTISMQLDPADLGRVDIKMDIAADGKVTAVISAEKQDTLDLLQQDSKQLQKALENAGLTADKDSFTFEKNDSQFADGNLKGNQREAGRQGGGQGADTHEIEMMAEVSEAIGAARTIAMDGAVNIVI